MQTGFGFSVFALLGLGSVGGLPEEALLIAALCATAGAAILTSFTGLYGITTFAINLVVLFAGAFAANTLLKGVDLGMDPHVTRPILLSLAGMAVASLPMLALMARDRLRG